MGHAHTTFEIDALLRKLAARQLGLVTTSQAAAAGIDKFALQRRRDAGALVPVFTGVLRLAAVAPTAEQRILGAALAIPGAVVVASSAAVVMQMPVRANDLDPIVSVEATRSARTAGMTAIRQHARPPSRAWYSARLATPAATLVMLPRFHDRQTVERCLDHCLAHRLVTTGAMHQLLGELPARAVAGRRQLLDLLSERAGGMGHRSGLERRVAMWLNTSGLRGYISNHKVNIGGGRNVEVDFAWPLAKVALEVSPFFTHGSRAAQDRDAERRRLLVAQGWSIVEATDTDLAHQRAFGQCVAALNRLLTDAGSGVRALGGAQRYPAHNHDRKAS